MVWILYSKYQRTSGPVNAHLTPGPGIYFNAFIHVYGPRAGADNPLLQVSKWSLRNLVLYTFLMILYIYIYSPRARAENPVGTNSWCQHKALITSTILLQVSNKSLWILILHFFHVFPHVYSRGRKPFVDKNSDVNRKALSLYPFVASFKKYLWSLILYIFLTVFIHVYSPREGEDNPLGSEFLS